MKKTLILFLFIGRLSAQDTIKISNPDAMMLMREHLNYPIIQQMLDTTKEELFMCKEDNKYCSEKLLLQREIIEKYTSLDTAKNNLQSKVEKDNRHNMVWRYIWRVCAEVFGVIATGEAGILYLEYKK